MAFRSLRKFTTTNFEVINLENRKFKRSRFNHNRDVFRILSNRQSIDVRQISETHTILVYSKNVY